MRKLFTAGAVSVAAMMAACGGASAAENISGDIGYNINSHFVSYGVDVWGGKNDFFGDRSTSSIYGDLGIKLTSDLTWNLNVWTDLNRNAAASLGGGIQELDINTGFGYNFGSGFSGSVTYGAWSYAGDVEEVLDVAVGYDDSSMWGGGFALMPKVTWHNRIAGNGAQKIGSAFVLGVGPTFPLFSTVTLSIPAGIAFFTTDNFQGGTEGGLGYGYVGGSLATPLTFIPAAYGAWSANFDLIGYFTKNKAIPGNPDSNFLTGSFNIKLAF